MTGSRFRYRAATLDGRVVEGEVVASSLEAARAQLIDRDVIPLLLRPDRSLLPRRRASRQDLAVLFRSVASLTGAGVPVERALEASQDLVDESLRDDVIRIRGQIREGDSVGEAMASHPEVFPRVIAGLITAGERASQLSDALGRAADQLEDEARLRSEIRSALAYPALVLVVGIASLVVMGTIVIPRFAELLGSLGAELPGSTRVVLWTSAALRRFGLPAMLGVIPLTLLVVSIGRRPGVRRRIDAGLLRTPLVGRIRHGFASARVCRSLGAMVSTGMPMLQALEAAEQGAGDLEVAARISRVRSAVARGQRLTESLEAHEVVVPVALQFVGAGEASGDLGVMLSRAGEVAQERAHRSLQGLVRLMEPALVIGLGLLVALTAAALLQAVYSVRPGG